MKSTLQEPTATRRSLDVEIPADEMRQEIDRATRRLAREVSLPGFRKGKTPTSVVRQRYRKDIEEEVIERLARDRSWQIIEENKLTPVTAPHVEEHHYEDGGPLTFRATFEIRPTFTLGSYKGLEAVRKRAPMDDALVEKNLAALREQGARLQPVEGRPLADGDVPVVDMQRLGPEGEPDGDAQVGVTLDLRPEGAPEEVRGALAGMVAGETRTLDLPAPPPKEGEPALANRYRITLKTVRERVLPDLDDDFARDVGGFDGLEALRARLRQDLERRAEERADSHVREQLVEQLLDAHRFPAPEALVDQEINRMMEQMLSAMIRQGIDPSHAGIDWEKRRAELKGTAEKRVRADLILDEVAGAEGLEVPDSEVQAVLQTEAGREGTTPAQLVLRLKQEGRLNPLKMNMLREKALDLIAGSANIIA